MNVCRICGKTQKRMIGIYESSGLKMNLARNINLYLPIKVTKFDVLTLKVCTKCSAWLKCWRSFVSSCSKTDKQLRQTMHQPTDCNNEEQNCVSPAPPPDETIQANLNKTPDVERPKCHRKCRTRFTRAEEILLFKYFENSAMEKRATRDKNRRRNSVEYKNTDIKVCRKCFERYIANPNFVRVNYKIFANRGNLIFNIENHIHTYLIKGTQLLPHNVTVRQMYDEFNIKMAQLNKKTCLTYRYFCGILKAMKVLGIKSEQ